MVLAVVKISIPNEIVFRSGADKLRLVFWLPVVDEVRTRVYGLSRGIAMPMVHPSADILNSQ
jgi:hypothetical protein